MTPRYNLSLQARDDLDMLWSHIAQDNPRNANRVEDEILEACAILAGNPHIGHKREDLTWQPLLFWSVYHYQIIYRPETQPLQIVHIVSGYRDIPNLLDS